MQVIRRPDQSTLAFLLGLALGVMATVSVVELLVHNAMESSAAAPVFVSAAVGALVYYFIDPLFPTFDFGNTKVTCATTARSC